MPNFMHKENVLMIFMVYVGASSNLTLITESLQIIFFEFH